MDWFCPMARFDETGNAKALAALKATAKEKDLKARVTGSLERGIYGEQQPSDFLNIGTIVALRAWLA
jgi:hypothetical protein